MKITTEFTPKKIFFHQTAEIKDAKNKIVNLYNRTCKKLNRASDLFSLTMEIDPLDDEKIFSGLVSERPNEGSAVMIVPSLIIMLSSAKQFGLKLTKGMTIGYQSSWGVSDALTGVLWFSQEEIRLTEVYDDGEVVQMEFTLDDLENFDEIVESRCLMIRE